MSFPAESVEAIKGILNDIPSLAILLTAGSILVGLFVYAGMKVLMRWTEPKPWWPAAAERQKAMALNFGYTEEEVTPKGNLEGWAYILIIVIHHSTVGLMLLPLAVFPEASGDWGVLLFYSAILLEFSYDIWDSIKGIALCFLPGTFTCMERVPIKMFIIMVVCHHTPILVMAMPLLISYPNATEFHRISCGLILVAGLAYGTGHYKFTLNTSEPGDFKKYKAIVVFQLAIILYARAYLWFTEAYSMLGRFAADGRDDFWWAGLFGIMLLSLFNLATIADATQAAIKWLPRKMPTSDGDKQDLEKSISASFLAQKVPSAKENQVQMS